MIDLIDEIVSFIPSSAMREHLRHSDFNPSILQCATLIMHYVSENDKTAFLAKLLKKTQSKAEIELIGAAIEDIEAFGFIHDKTQAIYNKHFGKRECPPFFPFLEVCSLPVLFKCGEVLSHNGEVFYIISAPSEACFSDFTDESYLCCALNKRFSDKSELISYHRHIHKCEADNIDPQALTDSQMDALSSIKDLIDENP
ncbi:MAG: hypothetical protein J6L90_04870 [Clostridia bacterium]|nr:hypothetical protein [Clostridia bacterium]